MKVAVIIWRCCFRLRSSDWIRFLGLPSGLLRSTAYILLRPTPGEGKPSELLTFSPTCPTLSPIPPTLENAPLPLLGLPYETSDSRVQYCITSKPTFADRDTGQRRVPWEHIRRRGGSYSRRTNPGRTCDCVDRWCAGDPEDDIGVEGMAKQMGTSCGYRDLEGWEGLERLFFACCSSLLQIYIAYPYVSTPSKRLALILNFSNKSNVVKG